MNRLSRLTVVVLALLAFAWAGPRARGTTPQKPPDTAAKPEQAKQTAPAQARPAEIAPEDYPPDFKAFNEAAKEKDVQKRVQALEKFLADNPKSVLVSAARSQIQSGSLTALRDARKKYLELAKAQVDAAKTGENAANAYSTYNRVASDTLGVGLLEEAEDYGRTGLSMMDEQKFIDATRQASAAAAARRAAAPAPDATPAPIDFSISGSGGVMVARPVVRQPAAKPAAARPAPRTQSDDQLRAMFRSQKASAQATLGQVLLKRGKTDEGERILKDACDAKPGGPTMATVTRLLADSAKKSGDDKSQLEYLTMLALTGRFTAAERQELDAVYRKAHGGSLDGIEEMLDARYRRENPPFEVAPFARKAPTNGRAVLVEMFTGAG